MIIVSTAFGGAWTVLVGGIALMGGRAAPPRSPATDAWILYPMTPAPASSVIPIAWIILGLFGTAVQLGITGRKQ